MLSTATLQTRYLTFSDRSKATTKGRDARRELQLKRLPKESRKCHRCIAVTTIKQKDPDNPNPECHAATGHFTRNEADRLHCALVIMAAAGCNCRARCPLCSTGASTGRAALAGGCTLASSFTAADGFIRHLDGLSDWTAGLTELRAAEETD